MSLSKASYNPIERVWGILEQHWNGTLLTDFETVIAMASSMTYHALEPVIMIVQTVYERGVTLSKAAFTALERRLDRLKGLAKHLGAALLKRGRLQPGLSTRNILILRCQDSCSGRMWCLTF